MNRFGKILFGLILTISLTACGNAESEAELTESVSTEKEETTETVSSEFDNSTVPEIEVNNNMQYVRITINDQEFRVKLANNDTTKVFVDRLPMTLDMSELNGNEKYYYFSDDLPSNSSRPSGIHEGDLMLYGSDCLVLFYESFSTSYNYTTIGNMEDATGLAEALGSGNAKVTFILEQ